MKRPARPGLLCVATRELRWMRRDQVALVLSILVPVIAFAVLTLTFSNAVIRNLRVTIVDADRSATSLTYVQAIGSAPGVSIAERSGDMTSAMRAIRSGEAIAAVYIPENFERDLLAGHRPQIVTLYNRQYFTPGNNANSTISNAIAAATATLPRGGDGGGYRPGALFPSNTFSRTRLSITRNSCCARSCRPCCTSSWRWRRATPSARNSRAGASARGCARRAGVRWSR